MPRNVRIEALTLVDQERNRQVAKWGDQTGNSLFQWVSILGEEYGEFCEAVNETCFESPHVKPEKGGREALLHEATHIAAVATSIIEALLTRKRRGAL